MRRETVETVQLAFQPQQNKGSFHNHKSKFHKGNKSHRNQHSKRFEGQTSGGPKETVKKNDQCKFCKKKGHWQKDCFKFKIWLEKKKKNSTGTPLALVCFESSLVDVPLNSWWIDSGASIHIANSLQGFVSKRRPSENEVSLCVGNGVQVKVEFIGVVKLSLESGFSLVLENTVFVPSMRRNLISISKLDESGFSFKFGNGKVELFYDSRLVGNSLLCDGLYRMTLASFGEVSCVTNVVKKRSLIRESSSMLWHKRLGHISKERMERLVKVEILPSLDFSDFNTCVDCIRGKLTKSTRKGSTRSDGILELIHTDISGPLSSTICGNKYFITFIDDFSRYGYVYLINDKSLALEKFKIFKMEVENQCGKSIKVVRSNRGG